MPYTRLYSVHPYWWERQVLHQMWPSGSQHASKKECRQDIHSGFETHEEGHMKSKTGAISGSTKWTLVQIKKFKKKKKYIFDMEAKWLLAHLLYSIKKYSNLHCILKSHWYHANGLALFTGLVWDGCQPISSYFMTINRISIEKMTPWVFHFSSLRQIYQLIFGNKKN